MAFTQTEYDTLKKAYAQGVLTVEYSDRKVTYRSKKEMQEILNEMADELGLNGKNPGNRGRRFSSFSKGLR